MRDTASLQALLMNALEGIYEYDRRFAGMVWNVTVSSAGRRSSK